MQLHHIISTAQRSICFACKMDNVANNQIHIGRHVLHSDLAFRIIKSDESY